MSAFTLITKRVQLLSAGNIGCQRDLSLAGRRAQLPMYVKSIITR
jgi:hypothetical protein